MSLNETAQIREVPPDGKDIPGQLFHFFIEGLKPSFHLVHAMINSNYRANFQLRNFKGLAAQRLNLAQISNSKDEFQTPPGVLGLNRNLPKFPTVTEAEK